MNQKHFNRIWRGFEKQNWKAGYSSLHASCMSLTPEGNKCVAGHLGTERELKENPTSNIEIIMRIEECDWSAVRNTALGKLVKLHDGLIVEKETKNFPRDFKRAVVRFAKEHGFKVPTT